MKFKVIELKNIIESDLTNITNIIANHCSRSSMVLHLNGVLGAGKTTFVRAFLANLGYKGRVKSPTYSLIETYEIKDKNITVSHLDLYRLSRVDELYNLGIDDYIHSNSVMLIEWPGHGGELTPIADIAITINVISSELRSLVIKTKDLDVYRKLKQI